MKISHIIISILLFVVLFFGLVLYGAQKVEGAQLRTSIVPGGGTGQQEFEKDAVLIGDGTNAIATTTRAVISGWVFNTAGHLTPSSTPVTIALDNQASTTRLSVFDLLYVGGTATTTIDSEGDVSIAGNATTTGWHHFADQIDVAGVATSTFDGNILVSGNLEVTGVSILSVVSSGNTTIGGTLTVTGASEMQDTLTFSGVATDITTGTNEHLVLSPNGTGNVGIGVASPETTLHVSGGDILLSNNQYLRAENTAGSNKQIIGQNSSDMLIIGDSIFNDAIIMVTGGAGYIAFETSGGSEQMRITPEGEIGIGDTSPDAVLNIASSTANTLFLVEDGGPGDTSPFVIDGVGNVGIASSTPYAKLSVTNTGSDPSFIVEDAASPDSTPFIIDASGNVGIGTTSPMSPLSIERGSGGTLTFGDSNNNVYWSLQQRNTAPFDITQNGTTRFTIEHSSGDVGIASTSPWGRLVVENTDAGNSFVVGDEANDSTPFIIDASGNVGIGTTSPRTNFAIDNANGFLEFGDTYTGNNAWNGNRPAIVLHDGTTRFSFQVQPGKNKVNLGTETTAGISFFTSNGDRMKIEAGGNVGIATNTPATTLDVNGLVKVLQTATTTCTATIEGSIFYNQSNSHFWGCDGSTWNRLDN